MRGKRDCLLLEAVDFGITPAHAGKTEISAARKCKSQDHPRACGENLAVLVLSAAEKGSPPRMRGKLSRR